MKLKMRFLDLIMKIFFLFLLMILIIITKLILNKMIYNHKIFWVKRKTEEEKKDEK